MPTKVESLRIKRLEALHYYVHDLERRRRFYLDKFDFAEVGASNAATTKAGRQQTVVFEAGETRVIVSAPEAGTKDSRASRWLSKHPDGVGSLVFANDYRHPALLAKEAATVDRLSGGRLEFGLGAGWMTTDYTATGIPLDPPSVRIARLEEALEVIRALWSGEPVEHHGRFYDISGLVGTPSPAQQPHPPIVIGGGGRKVLEVAGRHADVINLNPSLPAGVIEMA